MRENFEQIFASLQIKPEYIRKLFDFYSDYIYLKYEEEELPDRIHVSRYSVLIKNRRKTLMPGGKERNILQSAGKLRPMQAMTVMQR